jgi:hypothetical protein
MKKLADYAFSTTILLLSLAALVEFSIAYARSALAGGSQ